MAEGTPSYTKVDVIHRLAERFGYRRYLEFATSSTGGLYHLIDRERFDECRRLLYNAPADFADGSAIDYRSADFEIAIPLAALARERRYFDVILVDPYHAYRESRRDLDAALALLKPGGALVVHDCLPPGEELARPDFQEGGWCGVTYKAYLDFVIAHPELAYVTVDTDYGCGIVRKVASAGAANRRPAQAETWIGFGDDYSSAWRYFAAHQKPLLNLIDVGTFIAGGDGLSGD